MGSSDSAGGALTKETTAVTLASSAFSSSASWTNCNAGLIASKWHHHANAITSQFLPRRDCVAHGGRRADLDPDPAKQQPDLAVAGCWKASQWQRCWRSNAELFTVGENGVIKAVHKPDGSAATAADQAADQAARRPSEYFLVDLNPMIRRLLKIPMGTGIPSTARQRRL